MSKIICDICGTAYPDNAAACPICGYPRQSGEKIAPEDAKTAGAAAAATAAGEGKATETVKGGRFSKRNVKKRLRSNQPANQEDNSSGSAMKWVVAVLAVAVLLVGGYIAYRFLDGGNSGDQTEQTRESTSGTVETTDPTDVSVACTDLQISVELVELTAKDPTVTLGITAYPENTTDGITYSSSDESVVIVDETGTVTAVGSGSAVITVTCGEISRECLVNCDMTEETTEPSEETTEPTDETTEPTDETTEPSEETTEPQENGLEITHSDVTLRKEGETFSINAKFNGEAVALASVTWSTSDENIATVNNGKVTAVGVGRATITAEYNGEKRECIVRCSWQEETEPTDETEETTEATEPTETTATSVAGQVINPDDEGVVDHNWKVNKTDVTISVGETFTLRIVNDAGQIADIAWGSSANGIVHMGGTTVTGISAGTVTLKVTINSQTFTCVVRVK